MRISRQPSPAFHGLLDRSPVALCFALAAVSVAACGDEPAATPPRPVVPAPPPRPPATTVVADFRAVFAAEGRSRSVYMPTRDPDWGRRILPGPNLVFETSRTAVGDAPVTGPAAPPVTAPDQTNALGAPIDIVLSSRLLGYLGSKGATVLAPAVTRRWSPEWWCAKDSCNTMTWVERALLAHQARAAGKDMPHVELRADELPTAMLAVRRLGRVTLPADVVVEESGTTLFYRLRRSPADASICPPISIELPLLVFEAEIVSVRDGRILARIEEARQIAIPAQAQAQIEAIVPVENEEAVKALRAYAEAVSHGHWASAPPTLPYWFQSDMRCKNGEEALRRLAQQVAAQAEAEQEAAAVQMFTKALDPLFPAFGSPPPDEAKVIKGRPKGAVKPK